MKVFHSLTYRACCIFTTFTRAVEIAGSATMEKTYERNYVTKIPAISVARLDMKKKSL